MDADELHKVRTLLDAHEGRYRTSARRWKYGYRALLLVSLVCSAGASFAGAQDQATWASILAFVAALSTGILASLAFEENARINRRSRHEVGLLQMEAQKSTADPDLILAGLQEVARRRSDELCKDD